MLVIIRSNDLLLYYIVENKVMLLKYYKIWNIRLNNVCLRPRIKKLLPPIDYFYEKKNSRSNFVAGVFCGRVGR